MFTGIVQEVGRIAEVRAAGAQVQLTIAAPATAGQLRVGDSVSVSGACLTAVRAGGGTFTVEVTPETLRRTTLGRLRPGSLVNLELALRLGDRLGGHIVQGHVDGVGRVTEVRRAGGSAEVTISVPAPLRPYLVEKGSVAVDGVSLTVAALTADGFRVALIPHTLTVTTLGRLNPGDEVNIETDILGKYVARLLAAYAAPSAPPAPGPGQPPGPGLADLLRLHGFA